MKVKIGAVGPPDSLMQIREVANLEDNIELIEFEYTNSEQLHEILNNHRYEVTQWIFSGQTPYYYCLEHGLITEEEAGFPALHGISLLGTCMKVTQDKSVFINRLSLDTVDEKTVQMVLDEFSLKDLSFELLPYTHYKPYEELIDFHVSLYEKGVTQVALTCLLTVYEELTKKGIPCYRLVPSRLAIRNILNLLVSRANSQLYEKLKVAIIGFQPLDNDLNNNTHYIYEEHKSRLQLELELLRVAELLNGTLVNQQPNVFHIYTTYGDIEFFNSYQSIAKLVNEIELKTSLQLRVGIGSGYTIYEAKKHVNFALFSEEGESKTGMLFVDESKKVVDYQEKKTNFYTAENLPSNWKNTLANHQYTPIIPAKIYHFLKLKGITKFSSELITDLLKNTDRNTRRILQDLEQMGLLEVVSEENSGKPGRPRKIYSIK